MRRQHLNLCLTKVSGEKKMGYALEYYLVCL